MTLALVFFGLIVLVAIGVPIAIALGIVGLTGLVLERGLLSFYDVPLKLFEGATNFPLIAIPLFVLAGALMNTAGISKRLIALTSALVGFVRGGLAMVNVAVSLFFAEISGSAVADVAAIGSVLIPAMKKRRYKATMAAAVTSSSASLAIIIPPSIPMILYGSIADASIVQLFVAGIIPGLVGGLAMMALCWWLAVKFDLPREEAFDLVKLGREFKDAAWALLLPFIILGGIFGGIVTATEGAGLAVLASLLIGVFVYREVDLRTFHRALIDGIVQTGIVMLLVATSAVLGLYLDTDPGSTGAGVIDHRSDRQSDSRPDALEPALVVFGYVPARRGCDHSCGANRHAAGARGRHRSHSFRLGCHSQSGYRPTDASCSQCTRDVLLDCPHRYLGYNQSEPSIHWHPARVAFDGDLCSGHSAGLSGVVLSMSRKRPLLGIMHGDPGGIGPELLVKLLADPEVTRAADMVIIGDRHVVARGEAHAGQTLDLVALDKPSGTGQAGIIDIQSIDPADVQLADPSAASGRSCLAQLTACLDFTTAGKLDGFMFCPMNKAALHAANLGHDDEMQWIKNYLRYTGDVGEINALDGLWTSRVTSHVPHRLVADCINQSEIVRAIRLLTDMLQKSGIKEPRVAVCGLNPHAGDGGNIGDEEITIIAPAIEEARRLGYPCDGPWSADTIFVRAQKDGTDGIVTMYHDQGQIAMKLMGFDKGVTILGGLPVSITTPAHGTAYDIAGKGIADIGATKAAAKILIAMAENQPLNAELSA